MQRAIFSGIFDNLIEFNGSFLRFGLDGWRNPRYH